MEKRGMIVLTREHALVRHDLIIRPHQRPYLGGNGWWSNGAEKSNMAELESDFG